MLSWHDIEIYWIYDCYCNIFWQHMFWKINHVFGMFFEVEVSLRTPNTPSKIQVFMTIVVQCCPCIPVCSHYFPTISSQSGAQTIAKLQYPIVIGDFDGFWWLINQHLQNSTATPCLCRPLVGTRGFPGMSQNRQLKSSSRGWNHRHQRAL